MSDESLSVPKQSAGDVAIAAVRAAVGFIPYVGPAAPEIVNLFLRPPLERRRDKWMEEVAERLKKLESRGVDLTALQNDEAFVDTLLQASEVARRHHQSEKWEALRNAITNSALSNAPEESKRQMFLHFIDVFTVWHLRLLELFFDPWKYIEGTNKEPPTIRIARLFQIVTVAFPQLNNQSDFYVNVWNGLKDAGLVQSVSLDWTTNHQGAYEKRTTAFGDEFLAFIRRPESDRGGQS